MTHVSSSHGRSRWSRALRSAPLAALAGVAAWDLTTDAGPPGHIKFVGWLVGPDHPHRTLA